MDDEIFLFGGDKVFTYKRIILAAELTEKNWSMSEVGDGEVVQCENPFFADEPIIVKGD